MKKCIRRHSLCGLAFAVLLMNVAHAQQTTVLKILWEVKPTASDYMTTQSTSERDLYTNRGAFMYVPYAGITGAVPLYRLYGNADHIDSKLPNEAGYTNEGVTGYVWTSGSAVRGLGEMKRLVNPSTNDHAQIKSGDSIAGYTTVEATGAYGYPRYNKTAEDLISLTGGGVTISSNKVAGGALWSWNWNGVEFVNHSDYGREIQGALDWTDGTGLHNPTEAGSTYSTSSDPGNNQGSPLYAASNSGNIQTTLAVPLEWLPQNFGGGPTNPIIYSDVLLGKEITLNYNSMGPVAKYVTKLTLGSSVTSANLQAPAAFLSSTLSRYYTFDAQSQTLTEIFPASSCSSGTSYTPPSAHGAIILSNSGQTAAMAIAGKTTGAGGKLAAFITYDCRAGGNTSIASAYTGHITQPAGDTNVTTFIATDTLTNVKAHVRQLYLNGDI